MQKGVRVKTQRNLGHLDHSQVILELRQWVQEIANFCNGIIIGAREDSETRSCLQNTLNENIGKGLDLLDCLDGKVTKSQAQLTSGSMEQEFIPLSGTHRRGFSECREPVDLKDIAESARTVIPNSSCTHGSTSPCERPLLPSRTYLKHKRG